MRRHANEKFDSKSCMKGSYCEINIYIDETLIDRIINRTAEKTIEQ